MKETCYFFPWDCFWKILLYTVKIWHLNWFSKTLIPVRKYRLGDQTKDDRKKKGRIRSRQSDTEGAGGECAMLIKVLPYGRAQIEI